MSRSLAKRLDSLSARVDATTLPGEETETRLLALLKRNWCGNPPLSPSEQNELERLRSQFPVAARDLSRDHDPLRKGFAAFAAKRVANET
jgi:hypothetical protein